MAKPVNKAESAHKLNRESGRWAIPPHRMRELKREGDVDKHGFWTKSRLWRLPRKRVRTQPHRAGTFKWYKRMMNKCRRRFFKKQTQEIYHDLG